MAVASDRDRILRHVAATAALAPSIFNTQPWRWQVGHGRLRLWADHARRLVVADPEGRMLTISCGVGLHHARVALAATGHDAAVNRLPDPMEPDLLASIDLDGAHPTQPRDLKLYEAIPRRRTDRYGFGPEPVPEEVAAQLVSAAEAQGARVHLVNRDQVAQLALAAAQAGLRQLVPAAHRPVWNHAASTTTTDLRAVYAIIFSDDDFPIDWLRAGEALSAVLLTATGEGLGTAPISDITELSITRDKLRDLLPQLGVPQLTARIGHVSNRLPLK